MVAVSLVPLAADGEKLTIKTPQEIYDTHWSGTDEFKRSATRLNRLTDGLRTEVVATAHGFSEHESKALMAAIKVIDELASRYSKAAAHSKKRLDDRARAEKQIRSAMDGNFLALASVEDRIAFIGAVSSYRLRAGNVASQRRTKGRRQGISKRATNPLTNTARMLASAPSGLTGQHL